MSPSRAHFGGPDTAPGALRERLREAVRGVPRGGSIDWVTYYLRHRPLAHELLSAHSRGVEVRVTIEGRPRTPRGNERVIALLSGPQGLDAGFRAVEHRGLKALGGASWRPFLHEKIYCFSHPRPVAYVGSYNPTGDDPEEDPELMREAGDLERGHNLLVEIDDPAIVRGLVAHARHMHRSPHGALERLARAPYRVLRGQDLEVHFWPRLTPHPVARLLRAWGRGTRARIVASHLKGSRSTRMLAALARRGIQLEILADASRRRVPEKAERRLVAAGVDFQRVCPPGDLPMHNKFALIESTTERRVVFGSVNWTERSRWLSHEVAVISRDPDLYAAFAERWKVMQAQTAGGGPAGPQPG